MPALKGAFLRLDAGLLGGLPNVVVFQVNPESVSRSSSIEPPEPADGSGIVDTGEQRAEPVETMDFSLRLDASDQRAAGDPIAAVAGVLPALSALELLQHPTSSLASQLFGAGPKPHRSPPERLPTVLLFWGASRLLPVVITSLRVDETEYDQLLNPVRVTVDVSLTVRTPGQLANDETALRAYRYTHSLKEGLAAVNLVASPAGVLAAVAAARSTP